MLLVHFPPRHIAIRHLKTSAQVQPPVAPTSQVRGHDMLLLMIAGNVNVWLRGGDFNGIMIQFCKSPSTDPQIQMERFAE